MLLLVTESTKILHPSYLCYEESVLSVLENLSFCCSIGTSQYSVFKILHKKVYNPWEFWVANYSE